MRMVIKDAVREAGNDPIFAVAQRASQAIAEYGADNVVDSTLGALFDDEGNLICFDEVYTVLKNLPDAQIAGYAGIPGIPAFRTQVQEACFRDHRPDAFIEAVATPGGTGAIRNAVANYTNYGDKILLPDWHWAPYQTIAAENRRGFAFFELYDENGDFNMQSNKSGFSELLAKQGRILSILNTPAHNPTGYSISIPEWKELIDFYTTTAKADPEKRIIILVDIAYIDFAGEGSRDFMELLAGMPENVLVLYAFSASKGYTMYGLRNGAILCAAPNQETADEFAASCTFSNRGTWSNGTRCAMETLAKINEDTDSLERFLAEQAKYRVLLQKRADAFLGEAERVGLNLCSYRDGFFISIPCDDPKAAAAMLEDQNIFIVALKKGLRFAPCAVAEADCLKVPALIKKAVDAVHK